jgi:hypothetical protein
MIETFLDALNNPTLAHDVRRANPKTYDAALTEALRTEALFSETKRAREVAQALKEKEREKESKHRSRNTKGNEQKFAPKDKKPFQKKQFDQKSSV